MGFWQSKCERVRRRFLELEERRLPADEAEAVRVHLAMCEGCRSEWERWRAEEGALREALRPVPAPQDVAGLVVAALRRGASPRGVEPRRALLAWGLAAAAVALLAAGVYWAYASRGHKEVGRVAACAGRPMVQQGGARFASVVGTGAAVCDGAVLMTAPGEALAVQFADGSRLVLSGGTNVRLSGVGQEAGCGHELPHVCLRSGEVLCELKSLRYFRAVGTPLGSAIVEGTTFRVRYVGVQTTLEVLEGQVAFSCPGGVARAEQGSMWVVDAGTGVPRRVR